MGWLATGILINLTLLISALAVMPTYAQSPKNLSRKEAEAGVDTSVHRTIPARLAVYSPTSDAQDDIAANQIATPQLVHWLKAMIRKNLPETHEDNKKWGHQKEVWDGIDIWTEGFRIETKRKKKLVNTGLWTRYSVEFVDPDQNLHIEFHRLEALDDGRIAFHVSVDCILDIFGRLSNWVRDVQVISISANADAACRLTLAGTVQFQLNVLKFPPDVAIKPHVEVAHIDLTHYRVRRISQIGGDFAETLGQGLRKAIEGKLDELNGKLADKINAQLDKRSDRMSFSTQDWLQSKLPLPSPTDSPPSPNTAR